MKKITKCRLTSVCRFKHKAVSWPSSTLHVSSPAESDAREDQTWLLVTQQLYSVCVCVCVCV